jgi:hypothetical protein
MINVKTNNYVPSGQPELSPFPVLAKIVSHLEPSYMGKLEVQILRNVSGELLDGITHPVSMVSPFWGQTSVDYNTSDSGYDYTQKSYGMWMIPPDVGTVGIVIFINGNAKRGYWIGFVPDEGVNFMTPGIAATELTNPQIYRTDKFAGTNEIQRLPVAEYNKRAVPQGTTISDPTTVAKPIHPLAQILTDQGLVYDDTRGLTSSSSRRELPSMVFGISTPGPIDKRENAPRGDVGPPGDKINKQVSRLGGTTFVMDDGDSAFLRKGPASTTPPEYAAIEQGDTIPDDPTIPHNECVRIRTRTGHQILLHNSEDLIYIGNAKGTTWIELTSNGKIDIYAKDSISIHSEQDLNFRADRDINLEAGRNFNVHAAGNKTEEINGNLNLVVAKDQKITTLGNLDVLTQGHTYITSGSRIDFRSSKIYATAGRIYWNSSSSANQATPASTLSKHKIPDSEGATALLSIMNRVPLQEPWPHHENLNPAMFVSSKTDRNEADITVPSMFGKYTTSVDTFRRDAVKK